jgi:hypothetical protein
MPLARAAAGRNKDESWRAAGIPKSRRKKNNHIDGDLLNVGMASHISNIQH